jgi:hypothetical protein
MDKAPLFRGFLLQISTESWFQNKDINLSCLQNWLFFSLVNDLLVQIVGQLILPRMLNYISSQV